MSKRVTLKDVATAAGVHISTVSRALDPKSKTSLSDEVADRVRRVARDLGYRPNRMAAGLRTSRSMTVGVMIPDITNTIFPPIVRGIEAVLEPEGYASIVVNTDNLPDREIRLMEVLRERGVDGIISGAAHLDDPGVAEAAAQGVPVVTLNRCLQHSLVSYVIHDEEHGVRAVLTHLTGLGHRNVAHIAGPMDLSTGQARAQAYRASCRALGIPEREGALVVAARYDEDEGRRCTIELLKTHPEVTALVCANDRLAIGAYAGCAALGRSVPGDISITGFNDSPMLRYVRPSLTTVRVQQFEAGQAGARLLLSIMEGNASGPIGTVLPVELMIRDSTAAPRAGA